MQNELCSCYCILLASSSADTNSMTDPDIMNDSFVTSYDDVDLESNQSSDDDLPDVLSQDSKKSKSVCNIYRSVTVYLFMRVK